MNPIIPMRIWMVKMIPTMAMESAAAGDGAGGAAPGECYLVVRPSSVAA